MYTTSCSSRFYFPTPRKWHMSSILIALSMLLMGNLAHAEIVKGFQKISATAGGLKGPIDIGDDFGESNTTMGDLDGDGIVDIAVGTRQDDDGGSGRGAVYILFLNRNGTVKAEQKISNTAGGFTGILHDHDNLGTGVAGIGDLDGDGVLDIAVGARQYDGDDVSQGAVWILFLNRDGTVKGQQMIAENVGGFSVDLAFRDLFGSDIESLGDLDGDGVTDIAVSADGDDDNINGVTTQTNTGAFYILFLNRNGTVKRTQKISALEGGFPGQLLSPADNFGQSVANMGDVDGDGITDLAVGVEGDDDGGFNLGAAYILFMNADATVRSTSKISAKSGGFTAHLDINDQFGQSVGLLGDINNDGIPDLIVGAEFDDDGADKAGAAYILTLRRNGTVINTQKISGLSANFTPLRKDGEFGQAVTGLGDLDLDGIPDILVSSDALRDPGPQTGAVWVVFLNGVVNQAPVFTPIPGQTVTEGSQLVIPVSVSDTDGPAPLVLTAKGLPAGAVFTSNNRDATGQFRWTPPVGTSANGPFVVTFSAADDAGNGLSTDLPVTITVNANGTGGGGTGGGGTGGGGTGGGGTGGGGTGSGGGSSGGGGGGSFGLSFLLGLALLNVLVRRRSDGLSVVSERL